MFNPFPPPQKKNPRVQIVHNQTKPNKALPQNNICRRTSTYTVQDLHSYSISRSSNFLSQVVSPCVCCMKSRSKNNMYSVKMQTTDANWNDNKLCRQIENTKRRKKLNQLQRHNNDHWKTRERGFQGNNSAAKPIMRSWVLYNKSQTIPLILWYTKKSTLASAKLRQQITSKKGEDTGTCTPTFISKGIFHM